MSTLVNELAKDTNSCDDKGDIGDDELKMARHALALVSIDKPDWLEASTKFASLLWKRFEETKDDTLLIECIDVQRQICTVCTADDSSRATPVLRLAISLWTLFQRTGGEYLLAEVIDLLREALSLQPADHSLRYLSCTNLANALKSRFEQTGNASMLAEAVDLYRESLSHGPTDHSYRSLSYHYLANAIDTLFKQTGDESMLTEAIDLYRETLSLQPTGHPHRSLSINYLANALDTRFKQIGDESMLTEAIDLYREALSLQSNGHPHRSSSCNNLANALTTRFKQTGEKLLLSEAIDLHREALSLQPTGHPLRSSSCSSLAATLMTLFRQTNEQVLLAEAIDLNREALLLLPRGHPHRSISCNNLANALQERFEQTGDDLLLSDVIDLHREALSLRPTGHPERSSSCNNLANALRICFTRTGDESLLAEAIDLHRETLSLLPHGNPHRSMFCNGLASALMQRFEQTGDESLLAEAIDFHREALSILPYSHPQRSFSCNRLANALLRRFQQTGDESLLADAIGFHREALSLLPHSHPLRSSLCHDLAGALQARSERTGDRSLLIEVIDFLRESLSLKPTGHHDRSLSCSNLAGALQTRFEQTGDRSLLAEAIVLDREALSLQPAGHPLRSSTCTSLAIALHMHFDQTGDETLLAEAIDLNKEALSLQHTGHPSRWRPLTNLIHIYLRPHSSLHNVVDAISYLQQAISPTSDDWPALLSRVAYLTNLIDLSNLPRDSMSQLLECFSEAINLASRVAGFILDPKSQLRYLSSSQHLGPRAYWCAIACGQPQLGLELIERARAMVWTQALHVRHPQLSGAPPDLASELEALLSRMNPSQVPNVPLSLESVSSLTSHQSSFMTKDVRYRDSVRIHQLIAQIRAMPGHEGFMRGLSFEELAQCASRNPVVVLVAAVGECHALILQPTEHVPLILKLGDITQDELKAMSIVASAPQKRGYLPKDVHNDRLGIKVSASGMGPNPVLAKLWTTVVQPVIECLQLQKCSGNLRPRLHWCPTGAFMFLPLHAAGIYSLSNVECCADYVVSSYTPTLAALLRAQMSNLRFSKLEAKLSLTAVMNAHDANLPPLWNVKDEIRQAQVAAEEASIRVVSRCVDEVATVASVAEAFKSANMVHIACHGIQDPHRALSSGFCLSDGKLTISRLMDLDLQDAFFAFLGACETAKGDENQPDQIVHLAAAMLFVGFRSIVATMWAMHDSDGPRVAKWFYEKLLGGNMITHDAIPYALDYAIGELRKSGAPPERWATFIHMGV